MAQETKSIKVHLTTNQYVRTSGPTLRIVFMEPSVPTAIIDLPDASLAVWTTLNGLYATFGHIVITQPTKEIS